MEINETWPKHTRKIIAFDFERKRERNDEQISFCRDESKISWIQIIRAIVEFVYCEQ